MTYLEKQSVRTVQMQIIRARQEAHKIRKAFEAAKALRRTRVPIEACDELQHQLAEAAHWLDALEKS